ncbi:FlgO family outer membrane protein [Sphaerotilus sulfidivorans]|uniref:FlgO family outer membrane protein n=1 Tax=Sphaerotilus sp. FB-3 TaxID=2913396 RepID=UPI0020410DBA|nr:FlgO family outer membrane protein [Sphaerotilus sp. FB-3]
MNFLRVLLALAGASLMGAAAVAQPVVLIDERMDLRRQHYLEPNVYRYEPIISHHAGSPAGIFNSGMIFLAEQINRNVSPDGKSRQTVVTSFSPLGDLSESSSFGRLIGEHLMHELVVRGWLVADMRMTRNLIINDSGEFILSRDIMKIRESMPMANVVTGTYTTTKDGVLLSVRVLDVASGQVLSTAQTRFPRDAFVAALVDKPPVLPVVRFSR